MTMPTRHAVLRAAAALIVRFLVCLGVFYIAERYGMPTWLLVVTLTGALVLVERTTVAHEDRKTRARSA